MNDSVTIITTPPSNTQGPICNDRDGVPLSSQTQQRHYQNLYEHWNGDKAVVVEAARHAGVQLQAADGTFIGSPDGYKPSDIQLNLAGLPGVHDADPALVAKLHSEAVEAFGATGVSQQTAQTAIEAFMRTIDATPDGLIDEDAMRIKWRSEGSIINGLSNGQEIKRLAAIGEKALAERAPAFHAKLVEGFAFHSAAAQIALSNIGREVERGTK